MADMGELPDKVAALLDTARVLDGIGAPYALIGGVAVGMHTGVPRATFGTDIAVMSTIERRNIVEALQKAGFRLVEDFENSANFCHASEEPVQLAFEAFFDPMIGRAEILTVRGNSVRIVSKEDLIATKQRAAADPSRHRSKTLRDEADIEMLLGEVPEPYQAW